MADIAQLERALRNADEAGDSVAAQRFASEIRKQRQVAPQEQPGALDFITGESRETRGTRELPELAGSGLLAGEGDISGANVAATLATMSDPQEMAQVLAANYPQIGITYDEKGNIIATNNETGARAVLNKPGVSGQDVIQGLGVASLFTPAGASRAGLLPIQRAGQIALQSGLTSAGIEGAQAAAGGEFNLENVLIDTAAAGAMEAIPAILKGYSARQAGFADEALRGAEQAEAARVGQALSPEAQQAQQTGLLQDIATSARKGQKAPQVRQIAGDVAADPQIVQAAERLGVGDKLLPSQVSRNPQYVEIEQGLASIPGSKLSAQNKEAIQAVAQKADDLITDFGGTTDKAALSERIRYQIDSTISDLDKQAENLYSQLSDAIPRTGRVNLSGLKQTIEGDAAELGGEQFLEPLERRLLKLADSDVSYALLDKERKKIGQALRKASGPYKDADSGSLKRLYGLLTDAQESFAEGAGQADLWNTAKSVVSQRKQLEDQSIALLGRDKAGAIMPKVGQAVKRLTTGDFKEFDRVMAALPPEVRQEAVVSALNDAFTTGSRAEKQLSAPGFVDWYEGLIRNKAAKSRIDKNLPAGAGQRLDDLFKVARGIRNASKERITTGRIQGLLENFSGDGGAISKLYQTGRTLAAAEGATSAAGIPGAGTAGVIADALSRRAKDPITKAADELLSDPLFQKAAREYAGSGVRAETKRKAAEKALEKSARYQRWVSALPSEEARQVGRVGLMTYLSGEPVEQETQQQQR